MKGNNPSVSGPGHTMPGAPPAPHQPMASFERVGIRYGLYVGVAYILFFLFMKVLGLHEHTEVAYINGVFLVIGIVQALRYYRRSTHGHNDYLPSLGVGFLTSAVSSVILAFFFMAYSSFDKEFASHVMTANLYGMNMTVLMIFLVIIIQGTVGGFIIGFIAQQFYKRSDHSLDAARES